MHYEKHRNSLPYALFIIVSSSCYHNSAILMHPLSLPPGNPMLLKPLTLRFQVDYVSGLSLR